LSTSVGQLQSQIEQFETREQELLDILATKVSVTFGAGLFYEYCLIID